MLAYRRQGWAAAMSPQFSIVPHRPLTCVMIVLNIVSAVDDTGNWVALKWGICWNRWSRRYSPKKNRAGSIPNQKMFRSTRSILSCWQMWTTLYVCQMGKIALLEIKTTNYNAKDHWWKDGEEYVPVYYETQGRHCMAVMDMDEIFAYVSMATMMTKPSSATCNVIGSTKLRRWLYLEREFWHDHILTRILPAPYTGDGQSDPRKLRRRYRLWIRRFLLSS